MRKRHSKKLTRKQKRIKTRVKIRTLFLLVITLMFNTYAWFLYVSTVSSSLTAHVEAWHVKFKVDDELVDRDIPIVIEHAYPGMSDEVKSVTIINDGQKDADVRFAIKSIRIFDEIYIATDLLSTGDSIPQGAITTTSENLNNKIQNDYPFYLSVESSDDTIGANSEETLTITFTWQYESGDDETDTSYGEMAYSYYNANPTSQAIEMVIKLIVEQHKETV